MEIAGSGLGLTASRGIYWAPNDSYGNSGDIFNVFDTSFIREAAGILQCNADAASPVACTFKGADGSGTNIAGGAISVASGRGTGTGIGGALNFQTAPAGGSGSSQNALVTRFTINDSGHLLAGADNSYDIGASGATRPKNYYGAGFVDGAGGFKVGGTAGVTVTTCTGFTLGICTSGT